jgi:HSP90 family molecular chaperone
MTKVPVNFRIDSELLALAKAQAEQEGMTLIALLERSLKAELGSSASAAPNHQINVETLVDTVVKIVKTDIEQVKINLTDVETFVKIITESVNTIKAEVAALSHRLDIVSTSVDTIVNTNAVNTIVKPIVNTKPNDSISTPGNLQDWVNLSTIAVKLQIKPKSITDAVRKRGRSLGNDTIEFDMSGRTIHKQGKGIKAHYQIVPIHCSTQK